MDLLPIDILALNVPMQSIFPPVAVQIRRSVAVKQDGFKPSFLSIKVPITHNDAPVSGNTFITAPLHDGPVVGVSIIWTSED